MQDDVSACICECVYSCMSACICGGCLCYCLCVHVCACLASAPLQITNAPSSAPQQVPPEASGGDTASAVNTSGCCRVEEEIPASSCSVPISTKSDPYGQERSNIVTLSASEKICLRRLIFSERINSSPR